MTAAHVVEAQPQPFEPTYDLPADEAVRLTHEFLSQPGLPAGRYVCALVANTDPLSNVSRTVERSVFDDAFKNDNKVMTRLYGPREGASAFFTVFDQEAVEAAATLRVIGNSSAGIMTLEEAPKYIGKTKEEIIAAYGLTPEILDATWDVGTLAVRQQHRGKMSGLTVSTLLYRGYFLAGRAQGIKKLTAIIDPRARRNVALLGIPLETMCDSAPFEYEGSKDSTAVIGNFPDFEASVFAQAVKLRSEARIRPSDLLRARVGKIAFKKIAAKTATRLATGEGLDQCMMPEITQSRRLPLPPGAVLL